MNLLDKEKISVQKLYARRAKIKSVKGNFLKRLCTCLISMVIHRSKYKVDSNFIFISIEKNILEISYSFGENPGTNKTLIFIAHVLI